MLKESTERVEVWTPLRVAELTGKHEPHLERLVDHVDSWLATPTELKDPELRSTPDLYEVERPIGERNGPERRDHARGPADGSRGKAFVILFTRASTTRYNVHLQSPSWETEKNKRGLRDILLILDDNLCLRSVKTKVTMNRELQTDVALRLGTPASRKTRRHLLHLHRRRTAVGAFVFGCCWARSYPNANLDLKREDNIIVIESRGNFALGPLSLVSTTTQKATC